jgi:hypothetical protein
MASMLRSSLPRVIAFSRDDRRRVRRHSKSMRTRTTSRTTPIAATIV